MKKLSIKHPYFQVVEYDNSQCWVTLNEQFPIKGLCLALVEPLSNDIEIGSDVGFRYADGEIDWFWGHGETIEEAIEVALQNFINIVVHPDDLSSDNFVKREVIA